MSILETLKATRELLSDESKWTRSGNYASDKDGEWVNPVSEDAVCWCSLGGICKVLATERYTSGVANAERELNITLGNFNNIVHFNDRHSHTEVMEVFDKTIARLEGN